LLTASIFFGGFALIPLFRKERAGAHFPNSAR